MNIVLIHASDRGHGAERCVMDLHRTLLALGHRSTLYVGRKDTDLESVVEIQRPRVAPGLNRILRWIERAFGWQNVYAPGFRRLPAQLPADTHVVHVHTLWGAQGYADLGTLPALARRFPTVLTLHEQWLTTGHCACPFGCERWRTGCGHCPRLELTPAIRRDGTRANWRRKRRAMQRSQLHVTAVSEWLRQVVEASPIFAGKPVSVVHNGIDVNTFAPGDKASARAALGLPADALLVLMAGQAVEGVTQGIAQHWLPALAQLSAPPTALLVGGSASRAAQAAEACGVRTLTLPYQTTTEGMARCYQAADLTCVTSEYETFGRVAAESQACGTPVVAFATGGLPEVVCDGVTGRVVPTGDVAALAAALRELLADAARRAHLGAAAVTWARARFANPVIAEKYLDVYGGVMRNA